MNGNRNCSATLGIDYINIAFIAKSNVLPSGERDGATRGHLVNDVLATTTISHNIEMILNS
jgi:hypothetical protein